MIRESGSMFDSTFFPKMRVMTQEGETQRMKCVAPGVNR